MRHALILAAALAASAAQAQSFKDGNLLLSQLVSRDPIEIMVGLGYVQGVHDASSFLHCSPRGLSGNQLMDLVTAHLRANPSTRHYSADVLVTEALRDAFPCGKKGASL